MKQLTPDTVGGRIRQLRLEMEQTMDEFAAPLSITSSYLGFIERGTRNPSNELLEKIAEITEVDYSWLKTGTLSKVPEGKTDVVVDLAASLNPQLYLSIMMQRVPVIITREILATYLLTTPETVDKILAGETVRYDPRWDTSYSILAQNTDIATLRQDLHNIDDFLAREERKLLVSNLHQALLKYAESIMGEVEPCPVDPDDYNAPENDINLYLRSKADHRNTCYFKCYFNLAQFNESTIEHIVNTAGSAYLVFASDFAYDSVCNYLDKIEADRDNLANLDGVCAPQIPSVSLLCYDKKADKFEEKTYFDDYCEFPDA